MGSSESLPNPAADSDPQPVRPGDPVVLTIIHSSIATATWGIPAGEFSAAGHVWKVTHIPPEVQTWDPPLTLKIGGYAVITLDSPELVPELCVTAKNEKGDFAWFAMSTNSRPQYISQRVGLHLERRASRESKHRREQELKDNGGNNLVDGKRLIFHPAVMALKSRHQNVDQAQPGWADQLAEQASKVNTGDQPCSTCRSWPLESYVAGHEDLSCPCIDHR